MNKVVQILAITMCFTSVQAQANWGSLSGLASSLTESVTGASSSNMDLAGFVKQAQATNHMFMESRTMLASLIASKKDSDELKTKLKSLQNTSDLKEQKALQKEISKLSDSVIEASKKDEAGTLEKLSTLDSKQKSLLLGSMTNFFIAGLTARELVVNGKQISIGLISNPMSLSNTGLSLMETRGLISDIGGIAKNSTLALIEYPKLLKKAGIEFKAPESSASKPVDISSFL